VAVNFEQLSRDVPSSTVEIRTTMNELLEQIRHLSIDVHTLAHGLHSPKLEYLGIAKTMRGFCKEFGQKQKWNSVTVSSSSRRTGLT